MRLIQKILSHGLLIALIVAAIYVYIRRDELSLPWIGTKGQAVQQQAVIDKPGKETTTVTASNPEDASPETRQVSKEENSRPDEVNGATGQDVQEPAADNTTDPIASTDMPEEVKPAESAVVEHPEDVKPAEPAAVEHTEEQISSSRTEPTVNTEAESAAVVTEDKPVVTAMASLAATPETEVPAVPDTPAREQSTPRASIAPPDSSLEKQLQEARLYYWNRNLSAAESAYRMLSKAYPQNPDVWGEMGDFYFNLGQRKPASAAYYRSIELLSAQGEQERAYKLLGILYRLDAPGARKLEMQMQQAGG